MRLTVDDGSGRKPSTTTEIQVGGNQAPTATIAGPADESTYQAGQSITLSGSGSDAEDGALSGASLSWQVLLRHGTHLHQMGTYTGSTASFTTELDHDADSHYEITLTATDSGGRTHSRQIEIRPQTSNLTLASSPTGAPVSYDGKPSAPGAALDPGRSGLPAHRARGGELRERRAHIPLPELVRRRRAPAPGHRRRGRRHAHGELRGRRDVHRHAHVHP